MYQRIITTSLKDQIEALFPGHPPAEIINALESLGKKYRKANSKRINNFQMGRKVVDNDRPDLIALKNG